MHRKLVLKTGLLSVLLLVFALSSISIIQPVEAYTYLDIYGVPTDNSDTLHPTLTQYYHSSGKLIIASGGEANTTIRVWVISTSNTLESTTDIDVAVTAEYGIEFISIGEKDNDEVVIFQAHSHTAGAFQDDITTGAIFFNVNTYTYAIGSQVTTQVSVNTADVTGTRVFRYGNDYYCFMMGGDFVDAGTEYTNLLLCKKTNAGTYTVTASGYLASVGGFSWIYGVQDTEFNGRYVYLAYSSTGYGNIHYRKYDLSLLTYQGQANQPTSSGRMPDPSINLQMLKWNMIGAGIIDEVAEGGAENRTWVYFTHGWTYLAAGRQNVYVVHTRLEYNETDQDLDVSNLLGIDEVVASWSSNINGLASAFSGGWHINDLSDNFYVIYAELVSGVLTTRITEITVNNPYTLGSSTFSFSEFENPNYSPIELQQDVVGRNFSTPYQINLYKAIGRMRVYYGLTVFEGTYDVTLGWVPNDTPFYSDTLYGFSGKTLRNGVGTQLTTFVYKGDSIFTSFVTDNEGDFSFVSYVSVGVSVWTFRVYSSGESVYNETFDMLTVYREGSETEDISDTLVLPTTINYLVVGLAPLIFSIAPAMILGKKWGIIGLIIGLALGIGISAYGGLLPTYFLYLDILFIAIIILYFLRG